jgi:hypothetical protein
MPELRWGKPSEPEVQRCGYCKERGHVEAMCPMLEADREVVPEKPSEVRRPDTHDLTTKAMKRKLSNLESRTLRLEYALVGFAVGAVIVLGVAIILAVKR